MRAIDPSDPPSLVAARDEILANIRLWIGSVCELTIIDIIRFRFV